MSIKRQILDEQIEFVAEETGDKADLAFLKLSYALLRGVGHDDLEPEDIVDGSDDKQIDVISIEEDTSIPAADVLILQAKTEKSFSTNYLTLMGNGLSWIFEKPEKEYTKLKNPPFIKKIREIRDFRRRHGQSNMQLKVCFATKGDAGKLSADFKQELNQFRMKYSNAGFGSFSFEVLGAAELVDLMGERERREKQVNDDLAIKYDLHIPSYINYTAAGIKGYICTMPAKEIARLVSGAREAVIFDLNLRRFYGVTVGRVNPDIATTCSKADESALFWFFNNGITIVCEQGEVVADTESPHLKLTNIQIVNGCQTSMTLQTMSAQGKLRDDVEVLVKVFVTGDEDFVNRIVLTTNNQNAINSRNLKANDDIQADYQRAFWDSYSYHYERKQAEFKNLKREELRKVFSNEKIGQAYLAIVKKRPTTARAQKYRIWHPDLYREVFPDTTVEKHLLSLLIYEYCRKQKRAALLKWKDDDIRYSIVSYGVFHLARVVARQFTGTENWSDPEKTNEWIRQIEEKPDVLKPYYGPSVTLIKNLIKRRPDWIENIDNVFKATDIEGAINKALNK